MARDAQGQRQRADGQPPTGKVGEFVGNKVGHDKVDPIEDKIHGFVDGLANKDDDPKPAV